MEQSPNPLNLAWLRMQLAAAVVFIYVRDFNVTTLSTLGKHIQLSFFLIQPYIPHI